jgi:hypothetical protein
VAIDVDAEVRALYHGALDAFVSGRKDLAKRLRLAGDARRGEVESLRKPGLSAWGVNQLFAREGQAMAALVATGETARAAQSVALATLQRELARLAARGREILAEDGKPPGDAIAERLRIDLEALAFDTGAAAVAARQWLDDDLEPPGFEAMAALQIAAMAGGAGAGAGRASAKAGRGVAAAAAPKATVHDFADARDRRERETKERRERARREKIDKLAEEANRLEAEAAKRKKAAAEADRAARSAAEDARLAAERATAAESAAAAAARRSEDAATAAGKARAALQAALAD